MIFGCERTGTTERLDGRRRRNGSHCPSVPILLYIHNIIKCIIRSRINTLLYIILHAHNTRGGVRYCRLGLPNGAGKSTRIVLRGGGVYESHLYVRDVK